MPNYDGNDGASSVRAKMSSGRVVLYLNERKKSAATKWEDWKA